MITNTSGRYTDATDIATPEKEEEKSSGQQVANHLAVMGQLAAGVAHEINTPAQYVSDNIHFLQDAFDSLLTVMDRYQALYQAVKSGTVKRQTLTDLETTIEEDDIDYVLEQVPEAIQQSLEGMTRIIQIVEAMRDFSHPGLMEKKVVDINKAIRDTVTVTRNLWKYTSDLETSLDRALPRIMCQPGEINQVLLNLISNASDAVAEAIDSTPGVEKGHIKISTKRVDNWVDIQISDTGAGIPEAVRDRIFDPFFTTKPVGKGTGQGLAISASVIASHGGTLTCDTSPGEGTTFHIRLPIEENSDYEV